MPPKVKNARGASRKVAPAEEAPITSPTKKRGRPAKADVDDAVQDATESPRKRGRPAKATTEDISESTKRGRATTPSKGRGRPKKNTEVAKAADIAEIGKESSTAPLGRPRKEVVAELAQTPRGRGRPPKSQGLDLKTVAGSPRVSKRSAARSKPTEPVAVAARLNPRTRTKRVPPAKVSKEEPIPKPARRGRPPKTAAKAPATKKEVGRKAAETADSKPTKSTKSAKPVAPRKMRGHTLRQIPDKFVAQVDQYLYDLMQGDTNSSPAEHDQDQEHNMEDEADVDGNKNLEPTSVSTGDQDQEEAAQDAGTESAHAQDGVVDQYPDNAANEGETALDESGEPEQDMQSELNEEFTAADDENEDEIVVPADAIDMPVVDYENRAGLPLMEKYAHETLVAAT